MVLIEATMPTELVATPMRDGNHLLDFVVRLDWRTQ